MGAGLGAQVGAGRACVLGVRAAGRAGRWGSRRWGGRRWGASGSSARAWSAQAGERLARGVRQGAAAGAGVREAHGLGVAERASWLRAVHSVHLAQFRSVLTRYFPESNFLDIVREPGS